MHYYVLGDGAWLNFKVVKMQYITSGAWLRVSAPFQLIVLGAVQIMLLMLWLDLQD